MSADNDKLDVSVGEGASNVAAGKNLSQTNISGVTIESGDSVAGNKHVYNITPAAQEPLTPIGKFFASIPDGLARLYEPIHIKRMAQAEAYEAIISVKSQLKIQELEYRSFERVRDKEVRRQNNIESITEKAIKALPPSVSNEPVDEDWIYDFFERSQDVSNEQMQALWARILAREVAQPSSFSRRTLEVVKTLSASEATLFATCCRFVWKGEEEEDKFVPIILYDEKRRLCEQAGLTFTSLHMLQSTGLIILGDFVITAPGTRYHIEYFGNCYKLTLSERDVTTELYQFHVGNILFSQAGRELLHIVNAEPDCDYEQNILEYWKTDGVQIKQINF